MPTLIQALDDLENLIDKQIAARDLEKMKLIEKQKAEFFDFYTSMKWPISKAKERIEKVFNDYIDPC